VSDALIWSTSAVASIGSGLVVGLWGFATLGVMGAVIVAVVGGVLLLGRQVVTESTSGAPLEPVVD
jgi:hypothetical protein